LGFAALDKVKTPNGRDARRELIDERPVSTSVKHKPEVAFAGDVGRQGVIFDDNDVIRLLRAAVEREGSQTAFAKRHGIERTRINAILSGRRPVTESVVNALGLRRTYSAK
jgi:hypothetical protein